MTGTNGAVEQFGFDEAFPISEIAERLPPMLHGRERVYYDLGKDPDFDHLLIGWMNEFRAKTRKKFHAPDEIIALGHNLHEMRLFKSRTEITIDEKVSTHRGKRPSACDADL